MTLKPVMRESPLVWHLNQYLLTGVARSVGQKNQGSLLKTDYPKTISDLFITPFLFKTGIR
jgi:hypothetical protein